MLYYLLLSLNRRHLIVYTSISEEFDTVHVTIFLYLFFILLKRFFDTSQDVFMVFGKSCQERVSHLFKFHSFSGICLNCMMTILSLNASTQFLETRDELLKKSFVILNIRMFLQEDVVVQKLIINDELQLHISYFDTYLVFFLEFVIIICLHLVHIMGKFFNRNRWISFSVCITF